MTTPMCNGTTHTWSDDSYSHGSYPCPGPLHCANARALLVAAGDHAHARHADPDTSHAAAATVKVGPNQAAVLMVFRMNENALLDEELISRYNQLTASLKLPRQSDSGIRSRRAELAKLERLVVAGKRKMSTGGTGRTWKLA